MVRKLERKLWHTAREKGLARDAAGKYVYGALRRLGVPDRRGNKKAHPR
jgi:hypothetical protein